MMVPILLPALGETLSQRSGVLNLGIEGIMLMGASIGLIATHLTGSPYLGLGAALAAGLLFGLATIVIVIILHVDQVINGVGIWLLGLGSSTFLLKWYIAGRPQFPTIKTLEAVPAPYLSRLPFIGPILFQQNFLVYASILAVVLFWLILFKTTFGLKIRAVGENPLAAENAAINVNWVRSVTILVSAAMAGIGGCYLSIAHVGLFTHNMVAGRGFIAIAIVVFSKWNPSRAILGALIFGGADALQIHVQALGVMVPYQFLSMLPYLLTVSMMVAIGRKAEFPKALTVPYRRKR